MSNPAGASVAQVPPAVHKDRPDPITAAGGDLPLLVSPTRAAHELAISRWSVYQLMREGRLRAVQYGRRKMIRRQELERFICELEAHG